MADTYIDTTAAWNTANKFVVAADGDFLISAVSDAPVRFVKADSDVLPTVPVSDSHVLPARGYWSPRLLMGEVVFFVGEHGRVLVTS